MQVYRLLPVQKLSGYVYKIEDDESSCDSAVDGRRFGFFWLPRNVNDVYTVFRVSPVEGWHLKYITHCVCVFIHLKYENDVSYCTTFGSHLKWTHSPSLTSSMYLQSRRAVELQFQDHNFKTTVLGPSFYLT